MNYLFIGSEHRKIFISRLPSRKQPAARAVLLFYPFGQEYMRAHKAFRQLATLLSRKGFDVYRFDYLGTGDSYLCAENVNFDDYIASGNEALEHLNQAYSYESTDLIGLRLGAIAAACVSQHSQHAVRNLVLWDPYEEGRSFIDNCRNNASGQLSEQGTWNVHGFSLSHTFRQSIETTSISKLHLPKAMNTHLVISHENDDTKKLATLCESGIKTTLIGPANDWNYVDMVGSILMPTELIKQIVNTVAEQ